MNMTKNIILSLCLGLLFVFSCNPKESARHDAAQPTAHPAAQKDYLSFIIALDTLPSALVKKTVHKEDSLLGKMANKTSNPYYFFFKARRYVYAGKTDSALLTYPQMQDPGPTDDVERLKTLEMLTQKIKGGGTVEADLMKQIYAGLKEAEKTGSRLTYRFYDLLAQAYFQNRNEKKSLAYVAVYFENHPFKTHPIVKQRYFDISFLLASRVGDLKKMTACNLSARNLAKEVKDSLAIARTYDNEAQIYGRQGKTKQALACSKIYFDYLQKTNTVNAVACNNLATAFSQNKQPDSAIRYYRMGIEMEKALSNGKRSSIYYKGLTEAYKTKGEFSNALAAIDSAYQIDLENTAAMEVMKVAELHEKYETKKKDKNIADLNDRNKLNETIIKQQRWTLFLMGIIFLAAVSLFYIIYRQQRLREKNKLLRSQNEKLVLEQKVLQVQLNPHFIFNAIANLQSLIASAQTEKSVCYLSSFSGLLRGVLEQSRKDFIEIGEEVASLTNYLRLQQLRYTDAFDYQITVDDGLSLGDTLIPPMLIQPFVENSIEHGFRNINYKGLVKISFKRNEDTLVIEIDDNGSGLAKFPEEQQKRQSLAQVILKERIDRLFTANGQQARCQVNDKGTSGATGVRVEILIPIITE
ncbi:sensor histidine kinase [Pedobacter yulinensis]|uniref:Sensor histidine kinase n=1 Tax=Pedobacter yulinensis TaxID=2126353 RepID=A0A2T3HJQ1_9SPHI|nr:histidine kinase [Pedobacter yulinensis]PST82667.1 sensor histidine kinase [Pedobacter yulinensis]